MLKSVLKITIILFVFQCCPLTTKSETVFPLKLEIISSKNLNGTAGEFVTVQGQITNISNSTLSTITTYLSLADEDNKLPVDLEDWSSEKGLFVGSIEPGQSMPLVWKIHFVKSGTYSLIIIAEIAGNETPQVSSIVHFQVNPKHNLNPGMVLPVALGEPIILVFIMFFLYYRKKIHS